MKTINNIIEEIQRKYHFTDKVMMEKFKDLYEFRENLEKEQNIKNTNLEINLELYKSKKRGK